jgi:hypothetical protein
LARDIPFAIVPCCVYSQLFPKRKLKNGTQVTSYENFLIYLQEKDERIKSEILDFEGKNIVLYKL